eukprot:TRINITY_DN32423_c0_g1_i1.p1 TRINITY_DN32423_c0_g1~~TRINITY_DN32423_c0_g1_i1.p1  ORF type:complete len:137 (+),score=5.90 TRINITY_DN32423_c0_g1_i1:42-452(+)
MTAQVSTCSSSPSMIVYLPRSCTVSSHLSRCCAYSLGSRHSQPGRAGHGGVRPSHQHLLECILERVGSACALMCWYQEYALCPGGMITAIMLALGSSLCALAGTSSPSKYVADFSNTCCVALPSGKWSMYQSTPFA